MEVQSKAGLGPVVEPEVEGLAWAQREDRAEARAASQAGVRVEAGEEAGVSHNSTPDSQSFPKTSD